MKKILWVLLAIFLLTACSNDESTSSNEHVDYYNEYTRYIKETASAIDTAKKSYDVLVFLKSNPDYNISGLEEKAKNMLNRALDYAFNKSYLEYDDVNEIEHIVMNDYVTDSLKQQYPIVLTDTFEREKDKRAQQGVRIGMTQEEVLLSNWGKPLDINKTTTAYGTSEQWVYRNYKYLYFDDGILTTIQN